MTMTRRRLLSVLTSLGLGPTLAGAQSTAPAPDAPRLTDAEWKQRLTPFQYKVLRQEATEAPHTSVLNQEKRDGRYVCAGCALPLFASTAKYESGTGWPSFHTALPGAVATKTDYKMIIPRTEYHCAQCQGHQGHLFDDGPRPTGKRYCNNGVALNFIPA